MTNNKQVQKAGDGSYQIQTENITINTGITEQRAREIFREMYQIAKQNYTKDAYEIACKRVKMFEDLLMTKVEQVDGMLESFRDPSFQFLLVEAQKKAAASEREPDYALLCELLATRVQRKQERKIRAGISRAVQIVDEIDDDALCALTVIYSISKFIPQSSLVADGLNTLNEFYGSIITQSLPIGEEWIDHLDILGAFRKSPLGSMPKLEQYFIKKFDGYVCIGIEKDSPNHIKAMEILKQIHLSDSFLVDNELLDGYVRISVTNKNTIDELIVIRGNTPSPIWEEEKTALKQIYELYVNDTNLQNQVNERFIELLDSYDILRTLRAWWNSFSIAFDITMVGALLAFTNAKRCYPELPDML